MTMQSRYACVAALAGTDPSGGAGIQADIKAISATGAYAASIITALVSQNTMGVQAISDVPTEFVRQQIDSVFTDIEIDSVKIGMLHKHSIIAIVASGILKYNMKQIVIDPVMVAKNGSALLESEAIHLLLTDIFPHATLITPNLTEAEKLLHRRITTVTEMEIAAIEMGRCFQTNVLVKGGHLKSAQASDVLYSKNEELCFWFHADRIDTPNTHGTGCSLSSAIASYLAQGYTLKNAVQSAKSYLSLAIRHGSTMKLGKGNGPVDHFYFLRDQPYVT